MRLTFKNIILISSSNRATSLLLVSPAIEWKLIFIKTFVLKKLMCSKQKIINYKYAKVA